MMVKHFVVLAAVAKIAVSSTAARVVSEAIHSRNDGSIRFLEGFETIHVGDCGIGGAIEKREPDSTVRLGSDRLPPPRTNATLGIEGGP